MPLPPVLTPSDAAHWDRLAEAAGRPLRMLMETAGRAVARLLLERFGAAARRGVVVACGPGNNGGDGWVVARTLHRLGHAVWVVPCGEAGGGIAAAARTDAMADGVRVLEPDGPWPGVGVVVDALLGTGAQGAPRAPVGALLARLADLRVPVVAVDGPTGLDLATGVDHGVLPAALTITFGGPRRGHLLARDDVGALAVAEIGLPDPPPTWPRLVTPAWAAARLPAFPAAAHKGTRGRVVIVGGAPGMTGAARLAARAAFAAGAGLVYAVAPPEAAAVLATAEPDVQVREHPFTLPLADDLRGLLDAADAVVLGPGLGRAPERTRFVAGVLEASPAAVVDADALVALRDAELPAFVGNRPAVLTPHAGEFRTLFPAASATLEVDPWAAAAAAAAASGATVLLKGVPTVIAPAGGGALLTVAAGNPGLATGGSGDVLAGLIGGLLAQGVALPAAAALGAQALGDAADAAARRVGARAMRPMDVLAACEATWRQWERLRDAPPANGWLADLPAPRGG